MGLAFLPLPQLDAPAKLITREIRKNRILGNYITITWHEYNNLKRNKYGFNIYVNHVLNMVYK